MWGKCELLRPGRAKVKTLDLEIRLEPRNWICSWDASRNTATHQNYTHFFSSSAFFSSLIQNATYFAHVEVMLITRSSLWMVPVTADHITAADNWLAPDLLTLAPSAQTTHPSAHQTPRQNITRLRGIHIFVKINLSLEREEERAVNTNMLWLPMVEGVWGTVRFTPMGPNQIKVTNDIFCKHS